MECKSFYNFISIYIPFGFILTIWNVNVHQKIYYLRDIFCFILTIWNVNFFIVVINYLYLKLFYINYMECKSPLAFACCSFSICFILTIWNVNEKSDILGFDELAVLY